MSRITNFRPLAILTVHMPTFSNPLMTIWKSLCMNTTEKQRLNLTRDKLEKGRVSILLLQLRNHPLSAGIGRTAGVIREMRASLHMTKGNNPTPIPLLLLRKQRRRPRQRLRLRLAPQLQMNEEDLTRGVRRQEQGTDRDRKDRKDGNKFQRSHATTLQRAPVLKETSATLTIVHSLEVNGSRWRREQEQGHRLHHDHRSRVKSSAGIW